MLDKYVVVVRQRKGLFGWKRTAWDLPRYCTSYAHAREVCNEHNLELAMKKIANKIESDVRYVIVSIDEV